MRKLLILLLIILLILVFLSLDAMAAPVVWVQSRANQYTNFNGCVDNPITPNPIQTRIMPINFTTSVPSGHQIFVIVSADSNVSGGGCIALVAPWISNVTDNSNSYYTRFGNYVPNQGVISVQYEIWWSQSSLAGAQQLTITMGNGKLHVGAIIYDFSGINTVELATGPTSGISSVSGATPFSATWNNTAGVFLSYFFTGNGACPAVNVFPACVYPATNQNA